MKNIPLLISVFFFFLTWSLPAAVAQQIPDDPGPSQMERQYENYITTALGLQVKADSLSRAANQKRRELAFSADETGKIRIENEIINLEHESFSAQKQADSLYSQARAIELRIMSGQKLSGADLSDLSESARSQQSSGGIKASRSLSGKISPDFLTLGEINISPWLSSTDLLAANELEQDYARANSLMGEVSDINDEIAHLGQILDGNPRRRERRNINRRIEELSEQSFSKHVEALQIYEKVNALRYTAASGYLEERREQLTDSVVIKQGLINEELAREGFIQAEGLRQTALDLRSDKYFEGFILRAYTEELKAFNELEKALEIYNDPSLARAEAEPSVPMQSDGRIDPGVALSRARTARTASTQTASPSQKSPEASEMISHEKVMDYGFSILPEAPYSRENPVPENVGLPEGIVYSIQIGIFNTEMNPASFGGLYPVMSWIEPDNGAITYFAGLLSTFSEAEMALIEVNRQGFSDAFIVAYNNRSKIPVNRARQMQYNRQQAKNISTPESDFQQGEVLHSNPRAGNVIFKLQLGAFSSPVLPSVYNRWKNLAQNKNIEYVNNNIGLYVYSIGNFNTFDEAARMRNIFRSQGVPDAFVVPYKDDIRISMEEANKLLQQQ